VQGLGKRLRARAQELGLTDSEVARRLGLAQQRYSQYVTGAREPDYATLARICKALGTTPNDVLGFSGPPPAAAIEEAALRRRIEAAAGAMEAATLRKAAAVMDALAAEQTEGATRSTRKTTAAKGRSTRKR